MALAEIVAQTRRHETKLRFLVIGGVNTLVGLGVFPTLYLSLARWHLHYVIVATMSYFVTTSFSFMTNKVLVFKTRGNYFQEYFRFISFHLVHLAVNLAILPVLVEWGRMNPIWAQTLYAAVAILTSYFWYRYFTFRSAGT